MSPVKDLRDQIKKHYVSAIYGQFISLLGAVLKPTSLFSVNKQEKRMRDPRSIGREKTIDPYDGASAEGQRLLHTIDMGKYSNEYYLFHYPYLSYAEATHFILVSNSNFILLSGSNVRVKVEWVIPLSSLTHIRIATSGSGVSKDQYGIWLISSKEIRLIPSFSKFPHGVFFREHNEDFFVYYKLLDIFQRETTTKRISVKFN